MRDWMRCSKSLVYGALFTGLELFIGSKVPETRHQNFRFTPRSVSPVPPGRSEGETRFDAYVPETFDPINNSTPVLTWAVFHKAGTVFLWCSRALGATVQRHLTLFPRSLLSSIPTSLATFTPFTPWGPFTIDCNIRNHINSTYLSKAYFLLNMGEFSYIRFPAWWPIKVLYGPSWLVVWQDYHLSEK